jgi:hypothetical protein
MAKEIGWAEPEMIIGQPRIQKVGGFTYLYAEQQHVHETEVGNYILGLFQKAQFAYEELHGSAEKPPMLVMFINVAEQEKMYLMQAGYAVAPGTPAAGEARVRDIPPTLVASIVMCGAIHSVWKSYGPLMDFMNQHGLHPLEEGWREYYLYFEGPDSMNNITWVQHVAEDTD